MNPAITISLLSAILNTCIGFYVLILEPRKSINRVFFLFTSSLASYSIGEFFVRIATTPESALTAAILSYSVMWLAPGFILHWTYIFPRKIIKKEFEKLFNYFIIFIYIVGFILYLIFIRLLTIKDVILTEFGYRVIISQSTAFFVGWFVLICLIITVLMIYKIIRGKLFTYEKYQFKIIWIGGSLVVVVAVFTNFLPPIYNIEIFPMTSLFAFIFVLMITYSIVKYRFLSPTQEIIADKILETMNDIVIVLDMNKSIINANKATSDLLGYKKGELINSSIENLIHLSDIKKENNDKNVKKSIVDNITERKKFENVEVFFKGKTGNLIPMSLSGSVIYDFDNRIEGIILVARDLTDIKKSLKEKDVLLKEIHHRVKNNLQLISSLLELQSNQIKDKKMKEIFQESKNRLRLMSSFYEQLYQSKDVGNINFRDYIGSVSTKLFHSYKKTSNNIRFKQNIEDVSLDLNSTLLCSFIISELVSNSIKHAFPSNRGGEIKIDFHLRNSKYELVVSDDGIGIPENIDIYKTKTLGIQLVLMFVQQLKGELRFDRNNGTRFLISFPIKENLGGGK